MAGRCAGADAVTMTAGVLLVVVAIWCLVSLAIGLAVCRAISWARGFDSIVESVASEPDPVPREERPAVELPEPRSSEQPVPAVDA